ncbi:hypothetical protein M5K25_017146 [Dendrobium thyrsiflorum]|uniref:Uncharacterized protein n=1 Tax=Dendrobium thyrsiflorum TaxID=117978 RepID=A0ABD0ULN6_DENTH
MEEPGRGRMLDPFLNGEAAERTTVGTLLLTDGDPVGKVRESTTTVVTPHTDYEDPVGKVRESTPTAVTPHTNYGDPVGRVRTGKPTAVTPHTDYGDPVEKKTESTPTVVTPRTNYGDPVEKKTESTPTVVTPHTNYGDPVGGVKDTVAPRKITLIAKSDFSTGGRTFPERNWISCTESNSSGDSFGSRVMACVASTRSGGRTKSFSVSAGRDPVFPSEVTTNFSLSYIFLIQEEGEMCSVGTTTKEGEEETGKVKVLATVDLACGGLLSTASELCTACLIIPLVLRESASCHSSPELRGSGATTGGTTGSSLDVVGVPTSITWGATPKAVNCAVIVAMALAISAICACNCNTVASVSTERGGPPCAEVEETSSLDCVDLRSDYNIGGTNNCRATWLPLRRDHSPLNRLLPSHRNDHLLNCCLRRSQTKSPVPVPSGSSPEARSRGRRNIQTNRLNRRDRSYNRSHRGLPGSLRVRKPGKNRNPAFTLYASSPMEEQMRLYIRLAMEDSGFHLHTSMDNNMYNLINVTRFPSFDTSARMRSSIFNLHFCSYESSVLQALHGRPEVLEICGVGLTASCSTRVSRTGCREEEARSRSFDPAGRGREREATEVEVRSNLGPPEVCELEGGEGVGWALGVAWFARQRRREAEASAPANAEGNKQDEEAWKALDVAAGEDRVEEGGRARRRRGSLDAGREWEGTWAMREPASPGRNWSECLRELSVGFREPGGREVERRTKGIGASFWSFSPENQMEEPGRGRMLDPFLNGEAAERLSRESCELLSKIRCSITSVPLLDIPRSSVVLLPITFYPFSHKFQTTLERVHMLVSQNPKSKAKQIPNQLPEPSTGMYRSRCTADLQMIERDHRQPGNSLHALRAILGAKLLDLALTWLTYEELALYILRPSSTALSNGGGVHYVVAGGSLPASSRWNRDAKSAEQKGVTEGHGAHI